MLKLAGYINLLIAAFHVAALFFLEDAFGLTGVGAEMARAAEVSPVIPYVVTVLVTVAFTVFGLYGLSAAGVVRLRLPFTRVAVYGIGAVYLLRGLVGILFSYPQGAAPVLGILFSLTALGIGMLYVLGGVAVFKK